MAIVRRAVPGIMSALQQVEVSESGSLLRKSRCAARGEGGRKQRRRAAVAQGNGTSRSCASPRALQLMHAQFAGPSSFAPSAVGKLRHDYA